MQKTSVALAFLLSLSACTTIDRWMNTPPLRHYTDKLIAIANAKVSVARCGMFGESRKGFCVVSGTAEQVAAFGAGLPLGNLPATAVYDENTCLALDEFGTADGTARVAKPTTKKFLVRGSLPSNTDNVHVTAVYETTTAMCIEMEYPSG